MAAPSEITLGHALETRRSVRAYADTAIPLDAVKQMIWAGQGLTGENGLRTVPSAHGLHALRLVLAVGQVEGLDPGVYDVSRETGDLSLRIKTDARDALCAASVDSQAWVSAAPLVLTVCADFLTPSKAFADQKPYGRRGATYVAIEAGAVAQNIMLMTTSLGLGSVLVAGIDDDKTADVLGLEPPYAPVLHICCGVPA